MAGIPEFVSFAGRDGDGIARFHILIFGFNAYAALSVCDVVDLFGARVKMFLGARTRGQSGFGQTLVADVGVAMGEEFADFAAVFGCEGGGVLKVFDVHIRTVG